MGKDYSDYKALDKVKERLEDVKEKYVEGTDPYGVKIGRKYDGNKINYDLYPIPAYEGCAKVLTFGAKKYGPNEWKLVPNGVSRYYSALIRHLNAQKIYTEDGGKGLALDDETGLPHLDHAQCCLIFLREMSYDKAVKNEYKED